VKADPYRELRGKSRDQIFNLFGHEMTSGIDEINYRKTHRLGPSSRSYQIPLRPPRRPHHLHEEGDAGPPLSRIVGIFLQNARIVTVGRETNEVHLPNDRVDIALLRNWRGARYHPDLCLQDSRLGRFDIVGIARS